jgi:hypothetical protein
MPVIRDIPLSLETAEVLRRQGLSKRAEVRPEIGLLIRELLDRLEKPSLLQSRENLSPQSNKMRRE